MRPKMLFLVIFLLVIPPLVSVEIKVSSIRCSAVGIINISISWQTRTNPSNYLYSVYFSKKLQNWQNTSYYTHGCSLNSMQSNFYSCNIANALKLKFPDERDFNYFIKVMNGNTVEETMPMNCAVHMEMKCTDPVGLSLTATDQRSLSLTWSPPRGMGQSTCGELCYTVVISSSKTNEILMQHPERCSFTKKSLQPFTTYSVLLKCALDCAKSSKWSNQVGPIIATTQEEEPQGKIRFENLKIEKLTYLSRNVTIYYKLPGREKWNGKIIFVRVHNCCTRHSVKCENISLPPTSNRVVFPFLRLDEEYVIQAEYCNIKGCSEKSNNFTIKIDNTPDPYENKTIKQSSSATRIPIIIGTVFGILFVIAVVILIYIWLKKRRSSNLPLDQMVGPIEPSASDTMDDDHNVDTDEMTSIYASANKPSQKGIHTDANDFLSASARSLNNSFSMKV